MNSTAVAEAHLDVPAPRNGNRPLDETAARSDSAMRRFCLALGAVLVAAASLVACALSTAGVRIQVTPARYQVDEPFSAGCAW